MTTATLDQRRICEVSKWQKDITAATCTAGQKMIFLPDNWGNKQLPILFAAVNCELRYTVALTQWWRDLHLCRPAGSGAPRCHPAAAPSVVPHSASAH